MKKYHGMSELIKVLVIFCKSRAKVKVFNIEPKEVGYVGKVGF